MGKRSKPSKASEKLRDFIDSLPIGAQSTLAFSLKIREGYLSDLKNGHSTPSLELAFGIKKATYRLVKPGDWLEPVEEAA